MKKLLLTLIIVVSTLTGFTQVAVNTDGSSGDASAMLDVKSDTAGILIPRMTATQRDAINNPAQGLMVFVTDDSTFYFYEKNAWKSFSKGLNGWEVTADTVYNAVKRVGIGTQSPGATLDVHGHIWQTGTGHSVFLGKGAGNSETLGYNNYNVFIGENAGYSNVEYGSNVAIGLNALYTSTLGSNNIAIGTNTLKKLENGFGNTAVGSWNMYNNISGYYNSAFGAYALTNNTTGNDNIAVGNRALYNNKTNSYLVAIGDSALYHNGERGPFPHANYNTAVGHKSLFTSSNGFRNVALGYKSLLSNYDGYDNIGIGYEVLTYIHNGASTIGIGTWAGRYLSDSTTSLTDAKGSIFIGTNTKALSNQDTNEIVIGYHAIGHGSHTVTLGNLEIDTTFLNGKVSIGSFDTGRYLLPDIDGNANQVLQTNGAGQVSFVDSREIGPWTVSGNYIYTLADSVGVGTSVPQAPLEVIGRISENGTGYSTLLGFNAGLNDDFSDNRNVFVGYNAGMTCDTGRSNTALGTNALSRLVGGVNNVAIGDSALYECRYEHTIVGNIFPYNNTAIGAKAMKNHGPESYNTAIGYKAGYYSYRGDGNTIIGALARENAIAGGDNIAIGYRCMTNSHNDYYNFAAGYNALYSNSGDDNVGIGQYTLAQNSGDNNVAIGYAALYSNKTGNNSIALGYGALGNDTSGYSNIGIGTHTLYNNFFRSNLIAIGDSALYNNGTGATGIYQATDNTAVGSKSQYANTTGYYNTSIGYNSLHDNTTGNSNSAMGSKALFNNTQGSYNSAVGNLALFSNDGGNHNTAMGYGALYSNISGSENTAVGRDAGRFSTGGGNVFIGYQAGYNESGNNKLYISNSDTSAPLIGGDFDAGRVDINGTIKITGGSPALGNILTSDALGNASWASGDTISAGGWTVSGGTVYNATSNIGIGTLTPGEKLDVAGHIWQTSTGQSVFLGENAGSSDDLSNNYNVFVGYNAGTANTTGYDNTAIGYKAMEAVTDGHWNTALGHYAYQTGNYSNSTALGDAVAITANSQVRIGHNVTSIGGPQNWTNTSDGRFKFDVAENVPGLEFIKKLRPVTYHLDVEKLDEFTGIAQEYRNDPLIRAAAAESTKQLRTGFIAQEVEKAALSLGYDFSGVDKPKNKNDYYGLRYAEFVVPLVKAVQEQEAKIEQQQQTIAGLKAQLNEMETLKQRVEKLEKLLSK